METGHTPVDEVVDTALTIAPDADDRVRLIARQWSYMAMKEIGAGTHNIKTTQYLPVIDFSVRKPSDFYKLIDFAIYDSSFKELKHTFRTERGTRIHPQSAGNVRRTLDVSETNNTMEIASNGTAATWMKIRYFAFPVDDNGLPMIPETAVHAVVMYIRYMYGERQAEPVYALDARYQRWLRAAAQARGRLNTLSMKEGQKIAQEFQSMIQRSIDKVKYMY